MGNRPFSKKFKLRRSVVVTLGRGIVCGLLMLCTSACTLAQEDGGSSPPATASDQFQQKINDLFGVISSKIAPVLFFDISFGAVPDGFPLIVFVLMGGGIFFTLRFGFINVRLFRHSLDVIRGRYDRPEDHGEISHFQALTSALSATVGLGNIAMVAVAIAQGGPGAVFWMWTIAFFGMTSKFTSCSLAQIYRKIDTEGQRGEHVLGGPMVYLEHGIRQCYPRIGWLGKLLAVLFATFAIGGAIGGGNMFQANQTFEIVSNTFMKGDRSYGWLVGLVLAGLVGVVIIGGIKRIGEVTSKLVPAMCVFYCTVCLIIVLGHIHKVPAMFAEIIVGAFNTEAAGWGGLAAVFVVGAKRAAFSNEAGLGSAAIAHSAAKTNEPVREGVVAMIGPFIDTIVVCTMTSLTILVTRSHVGVEGGGVDVGITITANAFKSLADWLAYLLCIAVFIFAYSTMISWCYYGERAVEYLFGRAGIFPFRLVFLLFVVLGPIVKLGNLIDFTDLLILSMAYPNIVGAILLSPKLAEMTKDYLRRLKSGEMKPVDR